MWFGPVRTVFVTVCLGIWMQFAAVQSVAASDVATEFLLKTNSQKPSAILSCICVARLSVVCKFN